MKVISIKYFFYKSISSGVPPFFKRESFYIIAIIEERAVFNCKEAP